MTDQNTPMVKVPISRATARRLNRLKRPGESDNDLLRRTFDAIPVPIGESPDSPARNVSEKRRSAENELRNREWDLRNVEDRLKELERKREVCDCLGKMNEDIVLQRVDESCFHKVVEAWQTDSVIAYLANDEVPADSVYAPSETAKVFLVQHNWSGAFKKAQDFADGEWRLPYDESVFEMRLSGRRVCCVVYANDGAPANMMVYVETPIGWALVIAAPIITGTIINDVHPFAEPLLGMLLGQIRAIAIALEAEVVESEVVRAPYRLNQKRERHGRLPLYDFRVLNLMHRRRVLPSDTVAGDPADYRQKRLHFVRGHFRHYVNAKTWIKWHLRGNPDLGYIEKEYSL